MKTSPLESLLLAGLMAMTDSAALAQTEPELIATLQSTASAVQKCEACRNLRLVGTAKAVPALAALLNDERVAQAARFVLEGLPAPDADAALREALGKTSGLLARINHKLAFLERRRAWGGGGRRGKSAFCQMS